MDDALFPGFRRQSIDAGDARINCAVGGEGPPVLLLHGFPQTHAMWHRIAPELAPRFTVVCTDLRGYGDSSKLEGEERHVNYSKRAMAADQVAVMRALGFPRFALAGHDRGARVAHRLCLDFPDAVVAVAMLDIVPTRLMFARTDQAFATAYYHWFFLMQPDELPERLIGAEPTYYLHHMLRRLAAGAWPFDSRAVAQYERCFMDRATIHAMCEDYRAAATIDLEHDAADADKRIQCPLLALWGEKGVMHRMFSPVEDWRSAAIDVRGRALPAAHFLAEEVPEATCAELLAFFTAIFAL